MKAARKLINEMDELVALYESESVEMGPNFSITLTTQQVTQLKQAFAAKRTEMIAEVNAVSA
jgi:hypothetical protein